MNENFKGLITVLNTNYLLELFHISNMRYFELYVDGNVEYASKYKDICTLIRKELSNRGVWK